MGKSCKRPKANLKVKEVYRVENPDNPHQGCTYTTTTEWRYLPAPYDDGIGRIREMIEVCGTLSKKQFKLWWNRKLLDIEESEGKKALIFSVPKRVIKTGKHQCVFLRKEAQIIGELLPNGRSFYYLKQKG